MTAPLDAIGDDAYRARIALGRNAAELAHALLGADPSSEALTTMISLLLRFARSAAAESVALAGSSTDTGERKLRETIALAARLKLEPERAMGLAQPVDPTAEWREIVDIFRAQRDAARDALAAVKGSPLPPAGPSTPEEQLRRALVEEARAERAYRLARVATDDARNALNSERARAITRELEGERPGIA